MIGAEHSPGFEMMGGSLAQTLSQASGIALSRKRRGEAGRVFVFLSDGELQEGQTWEALQCMAFHRLDNLRVYIDVNGQQVDGRTADVMGIEPLDLRVEAFGCKSVVVDGHDPEALDAAAAAAGRPVVVLCRTDPCRGISLLEARRPKLHYVRFTSKKEKELYREFLAGRGTMAAAREG
jgi:transketolase